MQKNSGIKGNPAARSMNRNLDRELKRKEPHSAIGSGDICAPIVKTSPFSRNSERRRDDELRGGPQVGMGKAKISSDSRTQDLISDKNPKLNFRGDRMEENAGFVDGEFGTDRKKNNQGNTLSQP